MRRDFTYIHGVQLEEAVEITRHCFFRDDEMDLVERVVRNQSEFSNAYGELISFWNYERCLAEMHANTGKETFYYYGDCAVCNSPQPFVMDYQFSHEVDGRKIPNWRERLVCPNCGCNNRQRFIIHKVFEYYKLGMSVLLYEQNSKVFRKIKREIPDIRGFEYPGENYLGNRCVDEIICEDICHLSLPDNEVDMLVVNDVFANVYAYEDAFREAARVLKPGGKMIFTVPFDGNSVTTTRRAQITETGIVFLESKWERVNPIKGLEPLLVYQVFGWDVLESLKQCGFSDAYGKAYYGLKQGYLGYLPLYFEACK